MNRLTELKQKLADQKTAVNDLATQAERSTGGVTHRLLRKRDQASLAAQATQNDIDEVVHRVAYLRVARARAQENLDAMERYMKAGEGVDPGRARGLGSGRANLQREIDEITREIAKLDAPEKAV